MYTVTGKGFDDGGTLFSIDPNDWDGDGWHNDDDPDPKAWTGGDFGFEQALPTNANSDAYCWIDVRASYNTSVIFVGDGASNLPDPSFTARAGETNRVQLLIGLSSLTVPRPKLRSTATARSSCWLSILSTFLRWRATAMDS